MPLDEAQSQIDSDQVHPSHKTNAVEPSDNSHFISGVNNSTLEFQSFTSNVFGNAASPEKLDVYSQNNSHVSYDTCHSNSPHMLKEEPIPDFTDDDTMAHHQSVSDEQLKFQPENYLNYSQNYENIHTRNSSGPTGEIEEALVSPISPCLVQTSSFQNFLSIPTEKQMSYNQTNGSKFSQPHYPKSSRIRTLSQDSNQSAKRFKPYETHAQQHFVTINENKYDKLPVTHPDHTVPQSTTCPVASQADTPHIHFPVPLRPSVKTFHSQHSLIQSNNQFHPSSPKDFRPPSATQGIASTLSTTKHITNVTSKYRQHEHDSYNQEQELSSHRQYSGEIMYPNERESNSPTEHTSFLTDKNKLSISMKSEEMFIGQDEPEDLSMK